MMMLSPPCHGRSLLRGLATLNVTGSGYPGYREKHPLHSAAVKEAWRAGDCQSPCICSRDAQSWPKLPPISTEVWFYFLFGKHPKWILFFWWVRTEVGNTWEEFDSLAIQHSFRSCPKTSPGESPQKIQTNYKKILLKSWWTFSASFFWVHHLYMSGVFQPPMRCLRLNRRCRCSWEGFGMWNV